MSTRVASDQEIWLEVLDILQKNLSPSKVARVIAALRLGTGNYLELKDRLFGRETVKSLAAKIMKEQNAVVRGGSKRRRGSL